jgi:hypothetical protein
MISPTALYSNSNPSSGETSPSCSEYSSPSASPLPIRHPSQSIESSGSDENEKGEDSFLFVENVSSEDTPGEKC